MQLNGILIEATKPTAKAFAKPRKSRQRRSRDEADVAQLVRALDCGSGGRGFKSHHSPQIMTPTDVGVLIWANIYSEMLFFMPCRSRNRTMAFIGHCEALAIFTKAAGSGELRVIRVCHINACSL